MFVDQHDPHRRGRGQIHRRAAWFQSEAAEKVR